MLNITDKEMREIYLIIGKNVKKERMKKGISQNELSYLLGFESVSLISKAEIGLNDKHFNIKHLVQISKALNINIENFFIGVKKLIFS